MVEPGPQEIWYPVPSSLACAGPTSADESKTTQVANNSLELCSPLLLLLNTINCSLPFFCTCSWCLMRLRCRLFASLCVALDANLRPHCISERARPRLASSVFRVITLRYPETVCSVFDSPTSQHRAQHLICTSSN